MEEYDLYVNSRKPSLGLYVRKGAGLPDLADKDDWVFDGSASAEFLPPAVSEDIRTRGHAFREM